MISPRRLLILTIAIMLPVLVVLVRSIQIQLVESPSLAPRARSQQLNVVQSQSPRGTIFDRNGNVLAVSTQSYIVRINTKVISGTRSAQAAAEAIAPALSHPLSEVQGRIDNLIADTKLPTPTLSNILYANVTPQAANQLTATIGRQDILNAGVQVESSWTRVYPQGSLGGPTLGFVSLQPRGYSGVEGYYDRELSASEGVRYERGPFDLITVTPTVPGADLVLTIDSVLQNYVEQRLAQGVAQFKANGGTIIVMETQTGAVLASASYPGYDPNKALDIIGTPGAKQLHDPAVSDIYEPGSVIKLMTSASAIDAGTITTQTTFMDSGRFVVGGVVLRNSDFAGHGRVTLLGVLQHSLNVVAAQISAMMGPEQFYQHFRTFGVGRKSGIDLGGEVAGEIRSPADAAWSKIDLATNSFGQGMAMTPYQLLNAINAIANGGVMMQPYVVQQWRMADGRVINKRPVQVQRVVSADTARQLKQVAAESTRTASPAALPKGYTVAGKTGTATWYLRGVPQKTTIVTYVGWLPAQNPRITILVKFDQPLTHQFAAKTALPVFHDVAERTAQILGIPPDVIQQETK